MGMFCESSRRGKDEKTVEAVLLVSSQQEKTTAERDTFNVAYMSYFILGLGSSLPFNSFIIAVDYFTYLYPGININRIFFVVNMVVSLLCILTILFSSRRWSAVARTNIGLVVVMCSLVVVPLMVVLYVKGRRGLLSAYVVTVGAAGAVAMAKTVVESGIFGSGGELPERYLQATGAGISMSGLLVCIMRLITKAIYPRL